MEENTLPPSELTDKLSESIELPKKIDKRKTMPHLFKKGQSGNPAGRKKGIRNYQNIDPKTLLQRHAGALINKVIERALEGDTACLKMCMDRLLASQKSIDITKTEKNTQSINIFVENMGQDQPKLTQKADIIDVTPIEKPVLSLVKD